MSSCLSFSVCVTFVREKGLECQLCLLRSNHDPSISLASTSLHLSRRMSLVFPWIANVEEDTREGFLVSCEGFLEGGEREGCLTGLFLTWYVIWDWVLMGLWVGLLLGQTCNGLWIKLRVGVGLC